MATVTKKQLSDRIADRAGVSRTQAKEIVQHLLDAITGELAEGNRIEFRDFGVFEVQRRKPRTARNPRTGERVPVDAKPTVKFKPGRRMRETVEEADPTAPGAGGETSASPKAKSKDAARTRPGRGPEDVSARDAARPPHRESPLPPAAS